MQASELFKQSNTILLDGGMGTMLQAAGLKLGARPEELNITDPVSYTHLDVYKRQGFQFFRDTRSLHHVRQHGVHALLRCPVNL